MTGVQTCALPIYPTNGLGTAIAACVAKGILVFISSGDDGGNGWQCCYPASSNYVIACGGTTIYLSPSYTITLEQTWSGSGGAVSRYQSLPTWQTSPTLYYTTITSTGTIWYPQALPRRGVPDFSAPADPYTGYQFYVGGVLNQNGGTSAAAPLLAGCFTILDQVLGRRLGYNELMTALYANPSVFHDITVGQNNQDWHQSGIPYVNGYIATTGWDAATGLGSPNFTSIYNLFAPSPPPPPSYLGGQAYPRSIIKYTN